MGSSVCERLDGIYCISYLASKIPHSNGCLRCQLLSMLGSFRFFATFWHCTICRYQTDWWRIYRFFSVIVHMRKNSLNFEIGCLPYQTIRLKLSLFHNKDRWLNWIMVFLGSISKYRLLWLSFFIKTGLSMGCGMGRKPNLFNGDGTLRDFQFGK